MLTLTFALTRQRGVATLGSCMFGVWSVVFTWAFCLVKRDLAFFMGSVRGILVAPASATTRGTTGRRSRRVGTRSCAKNCSRFGRSRARSKRGGNQIAAGISNVLQHGHAILKRDIRRREDDVMHRPIRDCRESAESTEDQELFRQNHRWAPVAETLD